MNDPSTWGLRRAAAARPHTSGMLGAIEFDDPWEVEALAPVGHEDPDPWLLRRPSMDVMMRRMHEATQPPPGYPREVHAGDIIAEVEQSGSVDAVGPMHSELWGPPPRRPKTPRLRVQRALGGWRVLLVNPAAGADVEMFYCSTYERATSYSRSTIFAMIELHSLPVKFMIGVPDPDAADGDDGEVEVPGCWA